MEDLSSRKENEHGSETVETPKQSGRPAGSMNRAFRGRSMRRSKKPLAFVVGLLLIVAVATGSWSLLSNIGSGGIKKDSYQAVFLTNNQVYFGKLSNAGGDYLTMSNIYYLQVQQPVQPSASKNATPATATEGSDNVQLIKLGNELHGPEDRMQISNKQILFWENLKADGKVAKAIDKFKTDNK